jgi:DNA topoisomerase-1
MESDSDDVPLAQRVPAPKPVARAPPAERKPAAAGSKRKAPAAAAAAPKRAKAAPAAKRGAARGAARGHGGDGGESSSSSDEEDEAKDVDAMTRVKKGVRLRVRARRCAHAPEPRLAALARGAQAKKVWDTLEHCGVTFPPAYEPHGVKLIYDGEPMALSPEEEEARALSRAAAASIMHLLLTRAAVRRWRPSSR